MTEQWQELKETITEMRDNDGTLTQQEVCKFLVNYMEVLEKQMQEPTEKCKGCYYNDGDTHAECVVCDKEAQPTDVDCISIEPIQWYSQNKDGYLVKGAYSKDEAYVKLTDVYEKIRTSEDCISRQAVLDYAKDTCLDLDKHEDTEIFCDEIKAMPSVTPSYNSIKTELKSCDNCNVIKKLSKKYYVEDAYGYTDEDIVNKVNEIIDAVNGSSSTPQIEPCEDYISRKAVLNIFDEWFATCNIADKRESPKAKINALPSVTPTSEDIKEAYIKGYDYGVKDWFKSKTQPCDDCVRRSDVKEQMLKYGFNAPDMTVTEFVEDLPSVIPQRKRGKWVEVDGECQCSNCERFFPLDAKRLWVTCPRCNSYNGGGEDAEKSL